VSAPSSWAVEDGVGLLTLERPPANAIGLALVDSLHEACDGFDAAGVKVVVVRSTVPGFFVAGADLKALRGFDPSSFGDYLGRVNDVLDRIERSAWISIAAIDGFALGGGLELALACTFRVATARARLGVPEIKLGLLPGAGGTQRLPRALPRGTALDLLLTGRSMEGPEALRVGLVERLVGDGEAEAEARRWASELVGGAAGAYAAIKRCADAARDLDLAEGQAVERREVTELFGSADGREGVAAFVEKRPPRFG
jgi:enoyl-CoA hydratase/carnithine racemase